MILGSTFLMAIREVRRNTLRSVLTALGIVIGVAAVILMVTLGQSATLKITRDISQLGNNLLIITPGSARRGPTSVTGVNLTGADGRAIATEVGSDGIVAPSASRDALAVFGSTNYSTTATGVTNTYFAVRGFTIARGRMFSDVELLGGTPVCLLGATVRRELFHNQDPLDARIRVGRVGCRVIGVLASKGAATFGGDQDDLVLMPLLAAQRRLIGSTDLGAIYVSAASEHGTTRVKARLERLLRERRRIAAGQSDDFSVQDMKEIANTLGTVTAALTALLGSIAAVSLLVGGIGIMNIMLVSVTERTREIGIRLSIGALGSEVLMQFLVEAVVLSSLGGVLGLTLGLTASYVATHVLGLQFVLVPWVIVVAVVFSAGVGIAFGYVPARRAAALNPIEALRRD